VFFCLVRRAKELFAWFPFQSDASVMVSFAANAKFSYRRCARVAVGVAFIGLMAAAVLAGVGGVASDGVERSVVSLSNPRAVVLKSKRLLHLFDGDVLVRSYPIDLGRSPVGPKRVEGDGRTPIGRFHLVSKNADSPYHRFLGIDYPNIEAVEWGLDKGVISRGEAAGIRGAIAQGQCPDWGTALGGGIGIHGKRRGEDWTAGCIALSDEQVEELFSVLRIGDPVEVLP